MSERKLLAIASVLVAATLGVVLGIVLALTLGSRTASRGSEAQGEEPADARCLIGSPSEVIEDVTEIQAKDADAIHKFVEVTGYVHVGEAGGHIGIMVADKRANPSALLPDSKYVLLMYDATGGLLIADNGADELSDLGHEMMGMEGELVTIRGTVYELTETGEIYLVGCEIVR